MQIKVTKQQLIELQHKLNPLIKKALVGKPIKPVTQFMQGLVPMGEETIVESPDKVLNNYDDLLAHWSNDDAIGFGFLNDKAYVSYNNELFFDSTKIPQEDKDYVDKMDYREVEKMLTHAGISKFYKILYGTNTLGGHRSNFNFTGRLWTVKRIITFWQYPDKNKLPQLLKSLASEIFKIYDLNIDFSKYKIEVKNNEYQADLDTNDEDYEPDVAWEKNQKIGNLIPIRDFISSDDATEQEMQNIHSLPSDEKRNTPQMKAARDADAERLGNKFNGNTSQAEWNNAKKKYQGESKTFKITSSQLNEIKKHLNENEGASEGANEGVNSIMMGQLTEQYVYHASVKPIDKIQPYSEYKNNKSGYYPGMYFFNNKEISKTFYDPTKYSIYKTNIDGLKIYDLKDGDELKQLASKNGVDVNAGSGYREAYWLESQGYDGIKRGQYEVILFKPENLNIEKVENIEEDIKLPVNVGDTVLMGKFKNKKTVVKKLDKDSHGMPTINGKQAATFRTTDKKEKIEEKIYYRGENNLNKKIKTGDAFWDNNFFVTKDKNAALDYGNNVKKYASKPNINILTQSTPEYNKLIGKQKPTEKYFDYLKRALKIAKEYDYDIIEFERQGDVGTIVINKNSLTLVNDNLSEATESDVNLSSFKPKNELNEKFWVNEKIKPVIRKRLLKIADDFIDFLKIDIKKVEDVLFLGSLANYNWSKYSDIDLHLVIDMKKINKDIELVKDYFDAKKKVWSVDHDELKICGFPVEIYVQDKNEQNASVGMFSLEKNKWLNKPIEINDEDFNKQKIKEKAAQLMTDIDDLLNDYKNKPNFNQLTIISNKSKKLYDKIKRLRKQGLDSEAGEMSIGNIVFKVLRRNEYLGKLIDLKSATYDKINSIK